MAKKKVVEEEEYLDFSFLNKYFEEPVLVVSILTFLLTILKNIVSSSSLGITGTFLGKISIYFMATIFLGLVCLYFTLIYFSRADKREYSRLLVVLLIFSTSIFVYYSDQAGGINLRDYNILSVVSATFLVLYALTFNGVMSVSNALITAIFFSVLLTHVIPANSVPGVDGSGRYLDALDPYYYYRIANTIAETSSIPEKETLAYPTDMPSFSGRRFMVSVFMGSIAVILQPLGITVHDIAMVYAGVFAAFSSIVLYLLVRDLFSEYEPYNKAAAILAAFMLIYNPGFAAKAIASNCEDDALGMFLLIASYFLFVLSYRKKSISLSVIAGFSFLVLNLTWSGVNFGFLVLSIFAFGYPLINFLQDIYMYSFHNRKATNRSYIDHIPYFLIPIIIGHLTFLILHAKGEVPVFSVGSIPTYNLLAFGGAILVSFLLEIIRVRLFGRIITEEETVGANISNFFQRNIYLLSGIFIISGVLFLVSFMNPARIFDYAMYTIMGAKVQEIIGMTTAEQNPLCSDIFSEGCFKNLYNAFGVTAVYALFSIFILLYYTFASKKNLGPIFILLWSIPMIWGVVNKSQYQFTASVPIIALGSTFALLLVMKREDWESLRIIPTILIIILPFTLTFGMNSPLVGAFGGTIPMDRGTLPGDIIRWYPALKWIGEQPEDTTILTWWDYGHWITAISKRTSIADNTKNRRFIVQDLAKFHVLEEDEDEALKLAKKYNATHVVIDYTMIGKSGAPHFIATSNLTAPIDDKSRLGEHLSYGQCYPVLGNSCSFYRGRFASFCSYLLSLRSLNPAYKADGSGALILTRSIVYECNMEAPGLLFEIQEDNRMDIYVISGFDEVIPWRLYQNKTHASILGIHPMGLILSNIITGIDNPGNFVNFPTYRNLVYVPEKFNNYMMTRLYLGDYLKDYQRMGLAEPSIQPLEHFELVEEFRGSDLNAFISGNDKSYLGYVKTWKINYPENMSSVSS